MARRRSAKHRERTPDPKYGDTNITQFMKAVMRHGRGSVAEGIVYGMLGGLENKTKRPGKEIFYEALENTKPTVELKSRRVGGATYQVPVPVRPERQVSLAMRWLRDAARNRNEKTMIDRLVNEFMDAANNRGGAVKKKEETHKMADANKAFSHFKW